MFKKFTNVSASYLVRSLIGLVGLLLWLPLLGWGQTTLVNYDFNSATAPNSPVATATDITSSAAASKTSTAGTGVATGSSAFAANATAGTALTMTTVSSANTDYFQFTLGGVALSKYTSFKLYFQGFRTSTGPTALTLQYSVNGGAYSAPTPASTYAPGTSSFSEGGFDLAALTALNTPSSLAFRLLVSGSTGGTVRLDNFQVQATNTVDPTISSITPGTVAAGGPDQVIALAGSNFGPGSVVSFNGQTLATTYNSATSLTATIPAAALAAAGSFPVVVANPVAGGSTSSNTVVFGVTAAVPRWVGRVGSSWFEPSNWSTGAVPAATDDVLLDHSFVAASYSVSLDQSKVVSLKSLTINPGVGDSIFVAVPATNTEPAALTLTNSGTGAVALAIYNKGVVTNASGATSGSGIDASGSGLIVFIYNGGSYRHATARSHAAVVENLSAVAGTEQGIFDFRLPNNSTKSYALSVANRTYGTLILHTSPDKTAISYPAGSANSLTIQGNLVVGPGVTFTPTVGGDMKVGGNIIVQGAMTLNSSTSASSINQLVLNGTKTQTITGSIASASGIGLVINNSAGVGLGSPLLLNGPLVLTSGILTTTGLLTLSTTASISGGGTTSFINGPLARQTAAGAVSNLVFPTGSGASYRPVVLDATAQDATTYVVTQKEGAAATPTNLLASTSSLATLTRVSRVRSYTITPTPAANNFSGTVTLPYGVDDNVNKPDDVGFTVGKNSGGAGWQNIGNKSVVVTTAATATTGAVGTITSQPFTSFSDFALASSTDDPAANPLPVVLTGFGATRHASGAVQVVWATASEQHSAYFEVQRSLDGQVFAAIKQVLATGTTTQARSYAHFDGVAPAGALYYRLRQVDTDGAETFSPVVTLATAARTVLALYPTPTHDRLTVLGAAGQPIQVLDLAGRTLQTATLPASGELRLEALPAGTYLLRTVLAGQPQTLRFTKE